MASTILNSKKEVEALLRKLPDPSLAADEERWLSEIHQLLLKKKIRFPILEHAAAVLYAQIASEKLFRLCKRIVDLDETGSYVLAGKWLQLHLGTDREFCFQLAERFLVQGDKWYVCDIIGERVWGHSLLTQPQGTFPALKKNLVHENDWLIRSVGVAGHYAVKKGLDAENARRLFILLLKQAGAKAFHVKKGIGWAAKTVAKFHPSLVEEFSSQLESEPTGQWFRTKIRMGLGRARHAGRN